MHVAPTSDRAVVLRRLLLTAALSAVAVVVLYLFFVRTRIGQELDDGAFEGRNAVRPAATRATDRLLDSITRSSLAVLGGALVLVALVRRRWRLALGVVAAVGGAIVTSEVLKHDVLTRPAYGDVQGIPFNSYPSGHATIAMSLALGLVMVAPRRMRPVAAVLGAVFATAVGTGVLASGWHRPSDSLGAFAVALTWFTVVSAGLVAWRGTGSGHDDLEEVDPAVVWVGAAALLVLAALVIRRTVDRADTLVAVDYRVGYVVACVVIAAVGLLVVAAAVLLLEGTSLDPPRRDQGITTPPLGRST